MTDEVIGLIEEKSGSRYLVFDLVFVWVTCLRNTSRKQRINARIR